jgi:hypothetical protein
MKRTQSKLLVLCTFCENMSHTKLSWFVFQLPENNQSYSALWVPRGNQSTRLYFIIMLLFCFLFFVFVIAYFPKQKNGFNQEIGSPIANARRVRTNLTLPTHHHAPSINPSLNYALKT